MEQEEQEEEQGEEEGTEGDRDHMGKSLRKDLIKALEARLSTELAGKENQKDCHSILIEELGGYFPSDVSQLPFREFHSKLVTFINFISTKYHDELLAGGSNKRDLKTRGDSPVKASLIGQYSLLILTLYLRYKFIVK